MRITLADKFLAYLALLSGITLSVVAEYYSILGLMAIFSAAPISVVVMGIALGVGKITATLWLKQNWKIAPWSIRTYLLSAIAVLMLITSMGIFGFLSKAHSDQSLVSGDVLSKISIYDEKIKTAKENIEANRRQLKQMDEAVDQVMARSTSEQGADKSNAIRRSQQRDRAALAKDIEANQKLIATLNDEAAPIRAEVRKVEAEVGPIKYIAQFVYGETDESLLEKAVTWVIIILIVVFDPLAVTLLLASQYSFQWFRKVDEEETIPAYTYETFEKPTVDELAEEPVVEGPATQVVEEKSILEQHPYLSQPFAHFKDLQPMVYKPPIEKVSSDPHTVGWMYPPAVQQDVQAEFDAGNIENIPWEQVEALEDKKASDVTETIFPENPTKGMKFKNEVEGRNYIYNGSEWINYDRSNQDAVRELEKLGDEDSKKKNFYIIKDQDNQVKKAKE